MAAKRHSLPIETRAEVIELSRQANPKGKSSLKISSRKLVLR